MNNTSLDYANYFMEQIEDASKEKAKSVLKDMIIESVKDKTGVNDMNLIVYMLDNSDGLDNGTYMDILEMKYQSLSDTAIIDKPISDLSAKDISHILGDLKKVNSLYSKANGIYQFYKEFDDVYDKVQNKTLTNDDLINFLDTCLGEVTDIVVDLLGSSKVLESSLKTINKYIIDEIKEIDKMAQKDIINQFLLEHLYVSFESSALKKYANELNALVDCSWENGPTLDQLKEIYAMFPEDSGKLDPYLQWRYVYELEQNLPKGVTLEQYNQEN